MARIKVNRQRGEPGITRLKFNQWPKVPRPMRTIKSVRTLRKVDEAKGATMPESRNLLQRAGVGVRQVAPRIMKKGNAISTSTGSGRTVVRPPSPTNKGGVRDPRSQTRRTGRKR